MERHYEVIEDDDEPYLFVREWEDHQLVEEFEFLAELFANVSDELAFRADHPEHRDGTSDIRATDVELYEIVDRIEDIRGERGDD